MSKGDIYSFILCFTVFLTLTIFFIFLLVHIFKLNKKVIKSGIDDEKLEADYVKRIEKKECVACKVLNIATSVILILASSAFFISSIVLRLRENSVPTSVPTAVVCRSDSMAEKNEQNTYLFDNNLNDQFQTFDILLIHQLPKEEELKLYDVVVYKTDDMYVIHRIIKIEEPNESHPNERYFLLKGDANENFDKFPVLYSQMRGIYKGNKVDCVGSFVLFAQSPAGYLCVFLVVAVCFIIPIVDKKILDEEYIRLLEIGFITEDDYKKIKRKKSK